MPEPERKSRKRGGKATRRGLSSEQVPILVAADRTGATISAILPAVNADTIKDVLAPVLGKDTLLVTDGASFYPPCAATLGVAHETLNRSAGRGSGVNCTSRRSTAAMSASRLSCAAIAASLPNTPPAISSRTVSRNPPQPVTPRVPERRHGNALRREMHIL